MKIAQNYHNESSLYNIFRILKSCVQKSVLKRAHHSCKAREIICDFLTQKGRQFLTKQEPKVTKAGTCGDR